MNISNDKRLLILDDSEDLLWILKIFFEGKGYTVKSLPDADKIYSVIDTFYPDLLLMDVLLNGNDGRDICQKLRSNSHTKHLGILLTSASPGNLTDYKKYQADDFIEKPFDLSMLDQKISSLLSWLPTRSKAYQ